MSGAERYAASRATEDPKFTKGPERWLNAGCWTDEPQQRAPPAGGHPATATAGTSSILAGIMSAGAFHEE